MKNLISCCFLLLSVLNTHLVQATVPEPEKKELTKRHKSPRVSPSRALTVEADISYADADRIVKNYRVKLGYYHDKTSSWFSKAYIDKLYAELKDPAKNLDGIRLYLGRDNNLHAFLIIPTKANGAEDCKCNCPNKNFIPTNTIHQDVAGHAVHMGETEHGEDPGATLYASTGCPVDGAVALGIFGDHVVPCDQARSWVRHRTVINILHSDRVNTNSEWFESKFICDLKAELDTKALNGADKDGVRIYLARRREKDCQGNRRHVYLWVTTTANTDKNSKALHIDDYQSLNKSRGVKDNGEQCLNNCSGATLPTK